MASFNPFQFVKAPALDADQASSQLALQQRQQLVDMLKQQVMNPAPVQNYGAIASRTSPITPIVQALMARKAAVEQQGLNEQYSNLFNKQYEGMAQMFGGQPQSVPVGNDAQGQPQTTQQTPTMMQGVPDAKYAQAQVGPSQSPMNPAGLPSQMATRLYMQDPAKYVEQFVAPYYKPAELEAQLRAAGISPNSALGRQIAQQSLAKATNIAPVAARPGTALVNPVTNQPVFYNPNSAPGSMPTFGPNGMPQSIQSIPGAASAIAQAAGAETGAKTMNTPQTLPTAGGGSTVAYPSDVLGTPPALRGQAGIPQGAVRPQGSLAVTATNPTEKKKDPWETIPKLQVSSNIGAPDAFTSGVLKSEGEKHAELASQYGKEADLADQKIQLNNEALKVLPNADTGPISAWLTENRGKLKELGVPDSLVPGSGTVVPTLALNKYLKNSALQGARQIYGSRMTQNEVSLQTNEMSPSAHMTSLAIKSLIQQDNIRNAYAKQRAEDYAKYRAQGGAPLSFESWYAKSFPLKEFAREQERVQAIGERYTPQQILEEAQRRGINP